MSAWGEDEFGVFADFEAKGVTQRMRWVPPGTFWMGSPEDEPGRYDDEGPRHRVKLTRGYWLGDTPVTQELWSAVVGTAPSHFQGAQRPVEQVSWNDARQFCSLLEDAVTGLAARLPTEAEWERTCRAGSDAARYGDLDAVAWHDDNAGGETHEVKGKAPNALGLYDTLGNVWEWCEDWAYRQYEVGLVRSPAEPDAGQGRVVRGGSWHTVSELARAACRAAFTPDVRWRDTGFRLARSHPAK